MQSENELGDYLRARRAVVSPAEVGLPEAGSRRVPGLRRDEVALLAGVSTDYYVRLEQGRERHPSEQVLRAIAGALRLDDEAAAHLFRLGLSVFKTAAAATSVAPQLLRLMDGMRDVPAFVVGAAQDVLAANAMARELYSGFARYDNLLRMIFLDPFAREFYADWDHAARIAVGNLRASCSQFPQDERIERVVGELSVRSPAFTGLWARYEVRPRTHEDKHFRHPRVGQMRLHFEALAVTSAPGQHLSVYSADPGSAGADSLVLLGRLSEQDVALTDQIDPAQEDELRSRPCPCPTPPAPSR